MTTKRDISHVNKGFSLVELSVVLVVVSFIIGGLLTANVMVHESRVNATIVWVRSVQTAYMQFEDIYSALPGDMSNASSFFPGATNGNGNGMVDGAGGGLGGNGGLYYWEAEDMWFWNHITSAGLLKGQLFGNVVCCPVIPGYNTPAIPLATGITAAIFNTGYFGVPADTMLINTPIGWAGAGAIQPQDALEIDQKMDDGLPRSGTVYGLSSNEMYGGQPQTCYYQPPTGPLAYDVNNNTKLCGLAIALGALTLQ